MQTQSLRINRDIKAREIRLIDMEGQDLGIYNTRKALELSKEKYLDLVEVNPTSNPPICKLMDYGKFIFERKKASKHNTKALPIKELKLSPQIQTNDLVTRLSRAIEFLEKGHSIKLTMEYKRGYQRKPGIGNPILRECVEALSQWGKWDGQMTQAERGHSIMIKPL